MMMALLLHIYDDGSIAAYNGQGWTIYTLPGLEEYEVRDIVFDASNTAYLALRNQLHGGIGVFTKNSFTFTPSNCILSNKTRSLATDSKGACWIASDSGLISFANGTWSILNEQNGILNNRVRDVDVASNDDVWLVTENGVNQIRGKQIKTYQSGVNFAQSVDCFDDGTIWIGKEISEFHSFTSSGHMETITDNDGISVRGVKKYSKIITGYSGLQRKRDYALIME